MKKMAASRRPARLVDVQGWPVIAFGAIVAACGGESSQSERENHPSELGRLLGFEAQIFAVDSVPPAALIDVSNDRFDAEALGHVDAMLEAALGWAFTDVAAGCVLRFVQESRLLRGAAVPSLQAACDLKTDDVIEFLARVEVSSWNNLPFTIFGGVNVGLVTNQYFRVPGARTTNDLWSAIAPVYGLEGLTMGEEELRTEPVEDLVRLSPFRAVSDGVARALGKSRTLLSPVW